MKSQCSHHLMSTIWLLVKTQTIFNESHASLSVKVDFRKSLFFQRITSFWSILQIYVVWVPISAVEGPHWIPILRILADEQHGIFALGVWGMQVHMYCIEYWVWSWNICTGGMWYASLSLLGWGSDRLGGPTQYSILNTVPLDPNPRTLRINITVGLGPRCCQIYQGNWVGPLNTQYSILYPCTLTREP